MGLKAKDVITESDLEDALITHLQDFLLELGKGFCFEARQKRIIIDDEYYFPDLEYKDTFKVHSQYFIETDEDDCDEDGVQVPPVAALIGSPFMAKEGWVLDFGANIIYKRKVA